MGNGISKNTCFSGETYAPAVSSNPVLGDIHGHSFKYVPIAVAFGNSPMANVLSSKTPFFSLFGAAINANQATSSSLPSFRMLNELMLPQSSVCTVKSSCSSATTPDQAQPTRFSFSGHFLDSSGTVSTISNQLSRRPFMSGSRCCNEQPLKKSLAIAGSRLDFSVPRNNLLSKGPIEVSNMDSFADGDHRSPPRDNVQWAQGMAGEDRFQVAVSEERGWVFVGIYDGFLGPDATDYLFANLHVAVDHALKGVLSDNIQCNEPTTNSNNLFSLNGGNHSPEIERKPAKRGRTEYPEKKNSASFGGIPTMHQKVLGALDQALRETEEAFFKAAEEAAADNPEIGLMGSCVLVMLMKGENVYVMNVGNSRAVLARRLEPNLDNILGKATEKDLQQLKAEIMDGLQSVQLNTEHSTSVEEEVNRIKTEHNDCNAIIRGRVKGKLNITRAFGAGYLKEPKWNSMLLGAFKIDYIGKDPYINCIPSLRHHRIGPNDKFLVLSSDGLYQYFTNKEVVDEVEMFTAACPKGNPAEHLIGEVLLRAARKAGMEYHELLNISYDKRRRYHDDVSIIVISFKGRMWRSSV
ncbi:probable protein phosphatase 2C 31 isoform X2 [Triticum urartu]|uniref:probable protein phosphatase 2C 31 isoform X2 n=1 Tax=Triticum urartu TaxID=4572 RepID=UPI002044B184|nr:probable protein phosphatase 2C 31 isoform X2 [Triticum urartu]